MLIEGCEKNDAFNSVVVFISHGRLDAVRVVRVLGVHVAVVCALIKIHKCLNYFTAKYAKIHLNRLHGNLRVSNFS